VRLSDAGARLCAGTGAVAIAFSAILVKESGASPSTSALFRCLDALVVLVPLAVWEDRRFGPRAGRDRLAGLLAGLFFGGDLLCWHHPIEDVGAGLATVLANVQVVLVPLAAWGLLSERPARRVLIALPVTLVGVVLISGVLEGGGAYGAHPVAGAVVGVAGGALYAGALLLLRRSGVDLRRPAGPLCEMTASAAVCAAVVGALMGDIRFVPTWPSAGWLALLALSSQVLGWLLITVSLPRLPAATTSLLLMIQPVGSMLLGALIFSESPSVLQLVGVALELCAVLYATSLRAGPAPEPRAAGTRTDSLSGTDRGRGRATAARPRDRPRH
jgi:drug/metabolite transporter (DMT)-like permease